MSFPLLLEEEEKHTVDVRGGGRRGQRLSKRWEEGGRGRGERCRKRKRMVD